MFIHMNLLFDTLFSVRLREFPLNKNLFLCKNQKTLCGYLKFRDNFKWSISVPGQQMYQTFGKMLQGVVIKNVETNLMPR